MALGKWGGETRIKRSPERARNPFVFNVLSRGNTACRVILLCRLLHCAPRTSGVSLANPPLRRNPPLPGLRTADSSPEKRGRMALGTASGSKNGGEEGIRTLDTGFPV